MSRPIITRFGQEITLKTYPLDLVYPPEEKEENDICPRCASKSICELIREIQNISVGIGRGTGLYVTHCEFYHEETLGGILA